VVAEVQPGVVVAEVLPLSPAASAGLARGDVIHSVNGADVHSGAELRAAIEGLEERAEVSLRVARGGEVQDVKAQLDEAASVMAAG
jgi:S1-C subfamily serine protease